MKLAIDEFRIKKTYDYENNDYQLTVYGDYVEKIGDIKLRRSDDGLYTLEEIQKLNFDGGYVAFYTDKETKTNVIFRSHQDTFSLFYTVIEGKIYFSDDYYALCKKHNKLTWNLQAISDYFENSWNNICAFGRTPFQEINVVETWNYIVLEQDTCKIEQVSWKNVKREIVYNSDNLDEFKTAFFETLDYYLEKIHDENDKLVITVSSGLDANTMAARYAQIYPNNNAIFVTSKIDDITDESEMASYMQSVLPTPIHYVPISTEYSNLMELLISYIDKMLPPRFFNEINENAFLKHLKSEGIDYPNLNGMNADGVFGEFGGEYRYLFEELMDRKEWDKAKNVLTAINVSFPKHGICVSEERLNKKFTIWKILYQLHIGRNIFRIIKRYSGTKRKFKVLKVKLPKAESLSIRTHEDALRYASKDGASRIIGILYNLENVRLIMPYGGYRFQQLKYACDPYIFSDKVNKACMRYAVADLLPKEILNNYIKRGNPGVTLQKVMQNESNRKAVAEYIQKHDSSIVNKEQLLINVRGKFGNRDFLALSLMVFEDKLKEDFNIIVTV